MSASADSVTAQLANASINDTNNTPSDNAGTQQNNTAENEAVLASAAEGRRLYIGNLAYATTEGELKDFFKDFLV
jgi:RNA recognition motif-containing protein